MLNKWLKTKQKSILVTHTFTFTNIHLKHDLFMHICTNISHPRTTTYEHMHICNPPPKSGKIKCCHLANIEYFLSLVLFRLRSTSAATLGISCNTNAHALNSIEFCIVWLFLWHFVRHLWICYPICVNLLQLMCAVITHNSVKKRSIYINKWLSYSQL